MKFLLLSIAILHICVTSAQTLMNRDSLLKLIPSIKEDSAGAEFYILLGQQYENNDPELAKQYYKKAGDISERINYTAGVIRHIFNYTFVLNLQGKYDSGLVLNKYALELARNHKDSILLGKALFNTGTSYKQLTRYAEAAVHYDEGRKVFAGRGDSLLSAQANEILQTLYFSLQDYDKAIAYGEAAAKTFRQTDDPVWLGASLSNLGMSYVQKRMFGKAQQVYTEALQIAERIGSVEMTTAALLNLGDLKMQIGEFENLNTYYEKAIVLNEKMQAYEGLVRSYRGMAVYHLYKKNFPEARKNGLKSLEIATRNGFIVEKNYTLQTLSRIHFAMQDLKSAYAYLRESDILSDSILTDKIRTTVLDIEAKYQSQQKEMRIEQLENAKKISELTINRKNTLNYILFGSIASLLIISVLGFRNYQHKQSLQEQRINELETEKQLEATEAVLKGEAKERTRLSKDLHDGLGGMLSGIKHSFQNIKSNLILTPDNAQDFERSMDMLDSSIKEMRRVAHNMMPETLIKYGLDTALRDFCKDMNQSGAVKIIYQSDGMANPNIEQTTAITIYRIIQELVNNIIKHAAASQALVQINRDDKQLSITVEDDGKGFDKEILNKGRGIGWDNILTRIEFLKGRLDLQTEQGKGTSVHIEINT